MLEALSLTGVASFLLYSVCSVGWNFRGITLGWGALFFWAALLRFFISVWPEGGAQMGLWISLLLPFFWLLPNRPRIVQSRAWWFINLPILLMVLLILLHGYFPAFDVDSISYHMPSVAWLRNWNKLPLFQQRCENISVWFLWAGFEEFLSIPGLALDLPLYTGLLGTLLKLCSLVTITSLLPHRAPGLRHLATFLLLIDDHFFFSGQNRFVFLNPSLIGLISLLGWCVWRSIRGRFSEIWSFIAILLALPAVKLHGVYFSLGAGLGFAVAYCGRSGFKKKLSPPVVAERFALLAACALVVSVFVSHWVYGGSPLLPFSLGPFKAYMPNRGMELLENIGKNASFFSAAANPIRRMIYPGNLALKIAVVFLFLLPFLTFGTWKIRGRYRPSPAWISLAFCNFFACLAWSVISEYLRSQESRYPRYAMGLAILGICGTALSLRRPLMNAVKAFIPNLHFRVWLARIDFLVGLALAAWLIFTIDTRYFNIPVPTRPTWKNIINFVSGTDTDSLNLGAPHMASLMMPYVYEEIPKLKVCLAAEEKSSGIHLSRGDHLIIFGPYLTFPAQIIAPFAVQGTLFDGGGYLRLSDGMTSLSQLGLKYAVIPKEPLPEWVRLGAKSVKGAWAPLSFDSKTLCETSSLKMVRLL